MSKKIEVTLRIGSPPPGPPVVRYRWIDNLAAYTWTLLGCLSMLLLLT